MSARLDPDQPVAVTPLALARAQVAQLGQWACPLEELAPDVRARLVEQACDLLAAAQPAVDLDADVWAEATEYTVAAVPREVAEWSLWAITVARRSEGRWAVLKRGIWSLSAAGEWDYESIPSVRSGEWKAEHRFDLDTALRLAREHAPRVTVNGWTPAAAIERWRSS